MTKKILILGSLGYLGSKLTEYLSRLGYNVTGSDIGYFQYGVLYYPQFMNTLDKEAQAFTDNDLRLYDVVILLAGISNDPYGKLDPDQVYKPTYDYAMRIAKVCKENGIKFIFPSSCSIYGISEGESFEDSDPNPQTGYSKNKLEIEQGLEKLSGNGFSPIALRLATVFGPSPRMRFDLVINMLCGMAHTSNEVILNSNGLSWRPNVHIEDVCDAFASCIKQEFNSDQLEVFNIGMNENNMQIIEIAELIAKNKKGCKVKFLNPDDGDNLLFADQKISDGVDVRTYKVNFDKAHEKLEDFSAKWTIEEGVVSLLKVYENYHLDDTKFTQRDFYRLQQLEYLFNTKQYNFNI
jgi:nucleoside-diphosphate-sugar epimerase